MKNVDAVSGLIAAIYLVDAARDRRGRPIDAGEIRASSVMLIGFGLLAVGICVN